MWGYFWCFYPAMVSTIGLFSIFIDCLSAIEHFKIGGIFIAIHLWHSAIFLMIPVLTSWLIVHTSLLWALIYDIDIFKFSN